MTTTTLIPAALVRERLAAATPRKWVDAVVMCESANGWIELRTLDGRTLTVWSDGELLGVGEPVALHSVYDVLARGDERRSVLVA
jgi:hypothetical protein